MYKFKTIATALIISVALPTLALADADHGHGQKQGQKQGMSNSGSSTPGADGNANMMQGMMGGDMGSMMKMMHGGQSGMMGMMGGADHLQSLFDINNDGIVSPEELRTGLLDALKTYDVDGNGMLSLAEFETLHAAHIRELTVDRFQAFDADGDGQVTSEEFAAPAERINRMMMRTGSKLGQNSGMMDGEQSEKMMQNGTQDETKKDN